MNAHTIARLLHMLHEHYTPAQIAAEIEKAVRAS